MRKPLHSAVSLLLACSLLCGFLTTATAVEYCSCAEEDRIREWNEETEQIICNNCGLEIQIEDSSTYLPTGYGTTLTTYKNQTIIFQSDEWSGNQYPVTYMLAQSLKLTDTDVANQTITKLLYTIAGEVPAGATKARTMNSDGGVTAFEIQSRQYQGANFDKITGSVTMSLGFATNGSSITQKIIPSRAELRVKYIGGEAVTLQTVTCQNGVATFSTVPENAISSVQILFYWADETVDVTNWGASVPVYLLYTDNLKLQEENGVTTEDAILDAQNQTNGLLGDIKSGITNVINAITNLPELIIEGIKNLFIPTEEQMNILRGNWQVFLTNKMGFIYQMFQWVEAFFDGIISGLSGDDTGGFTIPAFPAFEAGGETVQLWTEPLEVDFSENPYVQTVQGIASPFILGVTAYHLWFSMADLMECFFAGKSYRDFSKRRDDA